jgi:hypothetical protein
MSVRTVAATALALLLTVAPAAAQQMVSAADPEGLVTVLQDLGYRASLESDSTGDPRIQSAASGSPFRIWFYGCDSNHSNCDGLNFTAGFNLEKGATLAIVNAWNSEQLLGYANLDDESDPFISFFVVTAGGISREAFTTTVERWDSAMSRFKQHIGFRD